MTTFARADRSVADLHGFGNQGNHRGDDPIRDRDDLVLSGHIPDDQAERSLGSMPRSPSSGCPVPARRVLAFAAPRLRLPWRSHQDGLKEHGCGEGREQ